MNFWKTRLKSGERIIFEVVGKESAWTQFSRIKNVLGGEKSLGEGIGEKLAFGPYTGDTAIVFQPYSRDGSGNVRQSAISVVSQGAQTYLLRMEDGGGNDFNDLAVRVSIVEAHEELSHLVGLIEAAE